MIKIALAIMLVSMMILTIGCIQEKKAVDWNGAGENPDNSSQDDAQPLDQIFDDKEGVEPPVIPPE